MAKDFPHLFAIFNQYFTIENIVLEEAANVTAELRQTPQEITAQGLILGFLPIWLIDFFIPSNIEDLTQAFFQTLASGNDGDDLVDTIIEGLRNAGLAI